MPRASTPDPARLRAAGRSRQLVADRRVQPLAPGGPGGPEIGGPGRFANQTNCRVLDPARRPPHFLFPFRRARWRGLRRAGAGCHCGGQLVRQEASRAAHDAHRAYLVRHRLAWSRSCARFRSFFLPSRVRISLLVDAGAEERSDRGVRRVNRHLLPGRRARTVHRSGTGQPPAGRAAGGRSTRTAAPDRQAGGRCWPALRRQVPSTSSRP